MNQRIPAPLRKLVAERANYRCEYCRISALDSFFNFHIDHIISVKHGGTTLADNLAYACQICNLNKGSDLFTYLIDPQEAVRFFHPRLDKWDEHFTVKPTGRVVFKTPIGEATLKILKLNHPDSVAERRELIKFELF
jgi:hypothetical protein